MSSVLLEVTIVHPLEALRKFSIYASLETGLEQVNRLVARGEALRQVQLMDQGRYLNLPLEAFDGQSLAGPLRQLQAQWQALLRPLEASKSSSTGLIQGIQHRVELYAHLCDQYRRRVERLRMNLVRAQEDGRAVAQKVGLIPHFEEQLRQQEGHLLQAQWLHQQAAQRLAVLRPKP
ncbi:hypothetical protein [Spirosoma koreense]